MAGMSKVIDKVLLGAVFVLAALVPVFWIATVVFAYVAVFGDGVDGRYDDASAVSFCVGFACAALSAGAWAVRDYIADREAEAK